ncbi:unnamed protein product [Effrenium voratum]|nr:unnamed protein product [Effrenium voratum]
MTRHGGYGGADDDDDARSAFPRLENRSAEPAEEGKVLLKIHQRREDANLSYEVWASGEGKPEIPMNVCATTVASWIDETLARRSPWLTECLDAVEGALVSRSLASTEEEDFEEIFGLEDQQGCGVACGKFAPNSLELKMPSRGAGHKLLAPASLLQCLEFCAPVGTMSLRSKVAAAGLAGVQLFSILLWAVVLELPELGEACRNLALQQLDISTVALVLGVGHAIGDGEMLRQAYWCVRETLCNASGVPEEWLNGSGEVRLLKGGFLAHRSVCKTPLKVLSKALLEDATLKQQKWLTATDCYTLCQVHRSRSEDGGYPHLYELRLDHSDEILMTAQREDEQSPCRIFAAQANAEHSEHCEDYLGSVVPNFWGTLFTLYDSGADVEDLAKRGDWLQGLPLRPRKTVLKIGYETNVFGDCPRKVSVEFVQDGERPSMENLKPRWDKKLNSYALPFFGRVKKASAKNFQLVVNADQNTIFLMFGKISKDVFCLDFRGPISPLEAMAIASAALAKKRAVS